jgi:hypothetical protein
VSRISARDAGALLLISLVVACASALVYSDVDSPLIDDWTYAWSVEHLLETGQLRVLDWSSHYPVVPILWAVPFVQALGFSFATLRLSTIVLAWIGVLAFFFMLRLAGVDRVTSVLGTLLLFFNPVFFVLSHSFMTDVPLVSVMNIAIAFYLLWNARGGTSSLGIAGVFSLASFLVRQLGALVPLASIAALGGSRPASRTATARHVLVGVLLPVALIGVAWWRIQTTLGPTSVYAEKTWALKFLLSAEGLRPQTWAIYAVGMLHALMHLGFFLAPLALWAAPRTSRKSLIWSAGAVTALIVVSVLANGHLPRLLEPGEMLSLNELGASRPLIRGRFPVRTLPSWAMIIVVGLVLASAAVLLARLVTALRSSRGDTRIVAFHTLLQSGAVAMLWLYYDRYYLPLLPGCMWLLLNAIDRTRASRLMLAAAIVVSAAVSITGTIDNFRYSAAVLAARESLLRQGASVAEVDAGYPLNGWWLYAHPQNLPSGWRPESDVPFVTNSRRLPYTVANSQLEGYSVVRVVAWSSLWSVSDRVYALRAQPAESPAKAIEPR